MSRRRHPAGARPLRSMLTTGAIALGVGMVYGVLLLVGTIHSTFDSLYDSVYGNTDVVVSGEQSIGSLPESTIDRVRAVPGVEAASGNIWSIFRTVDGRGKVDRGQSSQLYVVGVDYREPDATNAKQVAGRDPRRGEIELPRDWADENGYSVSKPIRLSTPTGLVTLRVSGLYEFEGGLDLGGYGTASMPIADARRIMDKPGVWDEIDVIATAGTSSETLRKRLDAALGRGVEVATPETKGKEAQDQIGALNIVLYFFSGIALFVGAFLILNSFNMTVLQRIREIGTLRALGASDVRVARSILVEAVVLALAGSLFGLALGAGLAILLIRAMQS